MPADTATMNYNSVILAGVVFITAAWWFAHAVRHYPGPKVMHLYIHDDINTESHTLASEAAPTVTEEKKA